MNIERDNNNANLLHLSRPSEDGHALCGADSTQSDIALMRWGRATVGVKGEKNSDAFCAVCDTLKQL